MRKWHAAHPGYAAASVRARRARDPEGLRAYDRAEYYRNLDKHVARIALNVAVSKGKVTRDPCEVCGDRDTHGHHEDYSRPLEVVWLCQAHHGERHRAPVAS